MNAEDFYEEFKEALRFLGPGWYDKDKIKVKVKKGRVVLKYDCREVAIQVEKPEGKSK